jgi:hypothetical protein
VTDRPSRLRALLTRISSDLGISLQALEVILSFIAIIVAIIGIFVTIQVSKPSGSGSPETSNPAPSSTSSVLAPTPSPSPTATSPTPTPTQTGTSERNTTKGRQLLTLPTGTSADLDSENRNWDAEYAGTESRFDIQFTQSGQLSAYYAAELAIVSGPASYETCQDATAYKKYLTKSETREGKNLCFKTSEKRYAYVTIENLVSRDAPGEVQLSATAWDPPFEE